MRGRGVRRPDTRWPPAAAVVLNFEARGSTGPVVMFETSRGQRRPWSTSTARRCRTRWPPASPSRSTGILPNDTDFTPFLRRGPVHRAEHRLHRRLGGLPRAAGHARLHEPGQPAAPRRQRAGAGPRVRRRRPRRAGRAGRRVTPRYFPVLGRAGPLSGLVGVAAGRSSRCSPCGAAGWLAGASGWSAWPRLPAGFGLGAGPAARSRRCSRSCCGRCWSRFGPATPNMLDPWRPGWFRAGGGRARRHGAARLVRAAAPPDRAVAAGASARSAWLAVLGRGAGGGRARRLLPGRAAGPGRRRWPGAGRAGRGRPGGCGCWSPALGGAVAVVILAPTV